MSCKSSCKIAFLLFVLSSLCLADTNLLINPGLENGTEGWAARSCKTESVSTPVHSGKGAVKASGRDSAWQGIRQSMFGKMESGKTYKISAWLRIENAPNAPVAISVEKQDDSGTKYLNVASGTATNKDWVLLSGTFTPDINGVVTVLDIYFEGPPPGVNFYVDDVICFGPEPSASKVEKAQPTASAQIDAAKRYQKIEGLGASGGFRTMELVKNKHKKELYKLLFKDLGLDIFRIRNTYEIDPNVFDETVEIVKGGKAALGGNLKILISSWTPPAYLKSNGSVIGGTLAKKDGKFVYDEFAKWWLDSLLAYQKAGVKAEYMTMQNEPDFEAKYDACIFSPSEDANLAGYDNAFNAVWTKLNSKLGKNMPKMLDPETMGFSNVERYTAKLDSARVYGYAHHLYDCSGCSQAPDRYIPKMESFVKFNSTRGNKPLFQTEFEDEPETWSGAMNTAILLHNSLTIEQVAAYLYWDLFWSYDSGMVSVDDPNTYTIKPVYYAFKQYSAFTDPGCQRIDASTKNTGLRMSAFLSPDSKKLTVVIINITADTDITLSNSFKGFKISKGEIFRSSKNEKCVKIGNFKENEPLKLPAYSITTLVLSGK